MKFYGGLVLTFLALTLLAFESQYPDYPYLRTFALGLVFVGAALSLSQLRQK